MSRSSGALRDGALWGSAAMVVLAAHLGGALWILHSAQAAAPPGLPQPIFVELAPMPQAAAPPAEAESDEVAEAEPEPQPDPTPEPQPEPTPDFAMAEPLPQLQPVPDMNSLFPPPPDAVVLQRSERPKDRPRQEPKPEPEPRVVEKKTEPRREKKEKAPEEQQARKAATQVRAPQAERSASASQGQPSARQVATWQSKVQSSVARHMRRAGNLRQGGVTVMVAFTIAANGTATNGRLASSTGDARTDAALARQVARLPRMPPHPSGKAIPISFPVRITN